MPLTLSILLTGLVCYEFSINFLQFEASIKLLNDLRVWTQHNTETAGKKASKKLKLHCHKFDIILQSSI